MTHWNVESGTLPLETAVVDAMMVGSSASYIDFDCDLDGKASKTCGIEEGWNDHSWEEVKSRLPNYESASVFVGKGDDLSFGEKGVQGLGVKFASDKEKVCLLSFRGTSNLSNWATDLDVKKTQLPGSGGRVHEGMYNAYHRDLKGEVGAFVEGCDSVFVSGQSLGGGIAQVAAYDIESESGRGKGKVKGVATFESPRLFDPKGATTYNSLLGDKTLNVTQYKDIIPHLPILPMGFQRTGKELYCKVEEKEWKCNLCEPGSVDSLLHCSGILSVDFKSPIERHCNYVRSDTESQDICGVGSWFTSLASPQKMKEELGI